MADVITNPATGVSTSGATFNGRVEVDDFQGEGSCCYCGYPARFAWGYADLTTQTSTQELGPLPGNWPCAANWSQAQTLDRDRLILFRAVIAIPSCGSCPAGTLYGETLQFKTLANAMTFGTHSVPVLGSTSATVAVDFNPNTVESVASVKVQYKRNVDGTWIDGSTSASQQGESVRNLQFGLVGLQASTLYDFRFYASRDAASDPTLTSGGGQFTTNAGGAPTGTTGFLFLVE